MQVYGVLMYIVDVILKCLNLQTKYYNKMCLCALKNSSYSTSISKFSAIEMCSRVIGISGSIMILVGGKLRIT